MNPLPQGQWQHHGGFPEQLPGPAVQRQSAVLFDHQSKRQASSLHASGRVLSGTAAQTAHCCRISDRSAESPCRNPHPADASEERPISRSAGDTKPKNPETPSIYAVPVSGISPRHMPSGLRVPSPCLLNVDLFRSCFAIPQIQQTVAARQDHFPYEQ